jgi:hypothetical protein
MRPENQKWCLSRKYNHELDKEFNNPNVVNVTKTSRLRYAGHMIRRPEDLSQRASIQSQTHTEKSKGQRLDALCSRQADMERSSSTDLNQILVVVPHK